MCVSMGARGGTIAFLTIDNRAKLNTLDRALMSEFIGKVEATCGRVRSCARWCFPALATRPLSAAPAFRKWRRSIRDSARDFITLVHRTCDCLRRMPVPVIAAIDGYALGAGLEVAVSCDLRVATTRAKFGMPEVKVGIPSVAEAALIPSLIGYRPRARTADAGRDR